MRRKAAPTTIVRAPKDRKNPYKMVRQATFEDRRLTWEDRGVLGYLLVKPDDWEISVADLWHAGNVGRDKVYRILAHLEEIGYLAREEIREQGKYVGVRYVLYEEPLPKSQETADGQPFTEIQEMVSVEPLTENQEMATRVTPLPETPYPVDQEHTNNEENTKNEIDQLRIKKEDEDEAAYAAVVTAWNENIKQEITPILEGNLRDLFAECGPQPILHGISKAVERRSLNFGFVAACARNAASGKERPRRAKRTTASPYSQRPSAPKKNYRPDEYADIILGAPSEEQLRALEGDTP